MARNRKKRVPTLGLAMALKATALCLLIGGAGIGYVWQKDQVHELGARIKDRENRLSELRYENEKRRQRLDLMLTTEMIERKARQLGLGLQAPGPEQRIRIELQEPDTNAQPTGRQLAGHNLRMKYAE
ncbi:MAG TPA: hypothetical protein VMS21_09310 [Methylomirabilota bacterium]|nr:hypothetical protein [Methylomirabilota bacterium]